MAYGQQYVGENGGPGKTERWVKWSVGVLLMILVPLIALVVNMKTDIEVMKDRETHLTQERLDLDRANKELLGNIVDSHRAMAQILQNIQADQEAMMREKKIPVPRFEGLSIH